MSFNAPWAVTGQEIMMASHLVCRVATAATIVVLAQASALAQGTEQQREACTPDVFRLCAGYIPDPDRITACLRGNGPRLSGACYDVFFPPQDTTPLTRSIAPRRRPNGPPPPPDDED
jgi:hypothetical protein